jgi:hypothetical protein
VGQLSLLKSGQLPLLFYYWRSMFAGTRLNGAVPGETILNVVVAVRFFLF